MPYKDPAKYKEYQKNYRLEKKDQIKEKKKEYRAKYREKNIEYFQKRLKEHKQNSNDSITTGEIIDQNKWDMWCNEIKRHAEQNKHPYSTDFTNDMIFKMMMQGCFYCGDIATTIDRIHSTLGHTLDNCVGCCRGCNISKGSADPATFIRKAYYRVRGEYYDDNTDIWYVNKKKPIITQYKTNARKKGVSFELTTEGFDILTIGNCKYCKRSPTTWFGVDRVVPSLGYVLGNVVSCCFDCNVDKFENDVNTMTSRNERIVERVITGDLIILNCEKVILHQGMR